MATSAEPDLRPLRSLDDLIAPLHEACKPRSEWRVGTEAEKHGVFVDGTPLPFVGARSVTTFLEHLAEHHGWHLEREHAAGPPIQLTRAGASFTLEPGAQLELSGAPLHTIHETAEEVRVHLAELESLSASLGVVWLGLGFQPFARREDLPWVPKLRYPIMRSYLPTRGTLAVDMMLRTCTVQSNHDYASETDAMRKLRVSLRVQPLVTAMFANSPLVEGRLTGERTHRGAVWLDVDPDRSGLLPFAWSDQARFVDYVQWALDIPMFLVKRGDRVLHNTGQTFRAFWSDGFEGERATREDWLTHLNTLFPEVRLKKTLEMRGADAQRGVLLPALPALWKGLLHDDEALSALETLGARWDHDALEAARPSIARDGLKAPLAGRDVGEWAMDVLGFAEAGLRRLGCLDAEGRDETVHLAPLRALLERGRTPADVVIEACESAGPDRVVAAVLDASPL
jgi:glutamate--cysteine ligase